MVINKYSCLAGSWWFKFDIQYSITRLEDVRYSEKFGILKSVIFLWATCLWLFGVHCSGFCYSRVLLYHESSPNKC